MFYNTSSTLGPHFDWIGSVCLIESSFSRGMKRGLFPGRLNPFIWGGQNPSCGGLDLPRCTRNESSSAGVGGVGGWDGRGDGRGSESGEDEEMKGEMGGRGEEGRKGGGEVGGGGERRGEVRGGGGGERAKAA